jgi:O-antigen ligase
MNQALRAFAARSGRERAAPNRSAAKSASRPKQPYRAFDIALAVYVALAVTKVHELSEFVKALQPAKLVFLVLIALAFSAIRPDAIRAVLRQPMTKWATVIAVLIIASVPGAVWPGYAFEFVISDYWKTILFFVIAAAGLADRRAMSLTIRVMVISAAMIAARLVSGAGPVTVDRGFVSSAFDPNESALLFLCVIPFALALASNKNIWKWVGYGAALMLVGGIVKTQSRGGFLGLIGIAIWMLFQARPGRRLVYVLAIAGGAAMFTFMADADTMDRFTSTFAPKEDYNYTYRDGRYQVWQRGMHFMWANPILGVGVQNFPIADGAIGGKRNMGYGIKYSAAHNSFVQIGAELGVLGLVAFIMMLLKAMGAARSVLRQTARERVAHDHSHDEDAVYALAAQNAIVAFIIPGFFLSFAYHPVLYFLLAVCLAVRVGAPVAADPIPRRLGPRHLRVAPR